MQQDKPKIVVGDPHQQIYSFNGAVNALSLVEEHSRTKVVRTCYLTQSFRFYKVFTNGILRILIIGLVLRLLS